MGKEMERPLVGALWWLGLALFFAGAILSGVKIVNILSTPLVRATIESVADVNGECRRVSGRKEQCVLQELSLTYVLPETDDRKIKSVLVPRVPTKLQVGDTITIQVDPDAPTEPLVRTLSGGWGFRLGPLVAGLLILIVTSFKAPKKRML